MGYEDVVEYRPSSLDTLLLDVMNDYARKTVSRVCGTTLGRLPSLVYISTDDPKDKNTYGLYWKMPPRIGISKILFEETIRPLRKKQKTALIELLRKDPLVHEIYRFNDAIDAFAVLCHEYTHHLFVREYAFAVHGLLNKKEVSDRSRHLDVIDEAVAVYTEERASGLLRIDNKYWSEDEKRKEHQPMLAMYYNALIKSPVRLDFRQKVYWAAEHGREKRMERPKLRTISAIDKENERRKKEAKAGDYR